MRAGRAGRGHGVVRALEPVPDRNLAGDEIDDVARDEERADAARAAIAKLVGVFGNALNAADAGADHHAGGAAISLCLRLPARIGQRLIGGGDAIDNEIAHLALLARLQESVRIERALAFTRNRIGDLAGQVLDLELLDPPCSALA